MNVLLGRAGLVQWLSVPLLIGVLAASAGAQGSKGSPAPGPGIPLEGVLDDPPEPPSWSEPDLPRGMLLKAKAPLTILRLKSGEWVQGELQYIGDDDVKLKGDKSPDATYDIQDVLELYSNEPFRLTLSDGSKHETQRWGIFPDGRLVLLKRDGTVIDRHRLALAYANSLYGESDQILKRWRGSVSLGAAGTFGNTRNGSLQFVASLSRQVGDWRFSIEGEVGEGHSDSEKNERSRRLRLQADYDLSLRMYLTIGYSETFYDKFQNIALRERAGSGLGYRVVRRINHHWVLEANAVATYTKSRRVEAGADQTDTGAALRLATRYWTELLNDDLKLDVLYEVFLGLADIEDTTHSARFSISYKLIKDFSINLTAIYDRVENPKRLDDGSRPKRNDLNLSLGIAWSL